VYRVSSRLGFHISERFNKKFQKIHDIKRKFAHKLVHEIKELDTSVRWAVLMERKIVIFN
jgi:hypothetical protein